LTKKTGVEIIMVEKTEFVTRDINSSNVPNASPRLTTKYMSKFEKAKLLGVRAMQISLGAPMMVTPSKNQVDPLAIAFQELQVSNMIFFFVLELFSQENKMPLLLRRFLPDGTSEVRFFFCVCCCTGTIFFV
jgi:DNA-directed RNA polymerase subunit K/omega